MRYRCSAVRVLFALLLAAGSAAAAADCTTDVEVRIVRGESLAGVLPAGSEIALHRGYYRCHAVERGDLVAYAPGGRPDPVVKVARGLPGDQFELRPARGGWRLVVNRRTLTTSADQPYLLGQGAYRVLVLYERDYKGKIPPDTYLLLGEIPSGTLDSTRFGLVHRRDLVGKIVRR